MKFKVTIQATVTKTIEVDDAASEKEACEIAHESFSVLNDDNQEKYEQETLKVEAVA